jgi:hypothetical protein
MSEHLYSPKALGQNHTVAVAIGIGGKSVTGDRKQNHAAIIYRDDSGSYRLAHLAWHEIFKHEDWNAQYHWVDLPGIDEGQLESFADWVVIIASQAAEKPIPYSVLFTADQSFDSTGRYSDSRDGHGLTCATFILAAFSDFGLQIADRNSWPVDREEDKSWASKILGRLAKYLAEKYPSMMPHVLAQARQRELLRRYRPEEVVACAKYYSGTPVRFVEIKSIAGEIDAQVKREQS